MYEATFELEALTPLFMRGADRRRAEFRSASVKGAMRWWFRALAGSYFGNDIAKLREAECRVFGCAGSGRSRVIVEVKSESRPKNVFFKPPGVFDRDSWINDVRYLFFSLKMTLPKIRNLTFYPPGSRFRVKLKSHSLDDLKLAVLSLWLAVTFGGFGFRARRGAGSMKITSMRSNDPEIRDFLNLLTIETVMKAVRGNNGIGYNGPEAKLRNFLEKAFGNASGRGLKESPYPTLRNIIVLVKETDSPRDALKELEKAYAGLFNRHKRKYVGGVRFEFADYNFSHDMVKKFGNKDKNKSANGDFSKEDRGKKGGSIEKERRFFFGLPLIYANWKVQMTAFKEVNSGRIEYDRRASPVWLSVKEIDGKYYSMVVLLQSKFLPDGYRLQLKKKLKNSEQTLALEPPRETLKEFLKEVREKFKNKGFERIETVLGISGGA